MINALVHPSRHVIIYAIIIISEIHLGNARSGFLAAPAAAVRCRRRPIYDHPDFFPAIQDLACPELIAINELVKAELSVGHLFSFSGCDGFGPERKYSLYIWSPTNGPQNVWSPEQIVSKIFDPLDNWSQK